MFDNDVDNFYKLYEYVKSHDELFKENRESKELRIINLKTDIEKMGIKTIEIEATVEKLKTVQVIGYGVGGFGNVGNAWGAFIFTEYSDYLYEIIKKFETFNTPINRL